MSVGHIRSFSSWYVKRARVIRASFSFLLCLQIQLRDEDVRDFVSVVLSAAIQSDLPVHLSNQLIPSMLLLRLDDLILNRGEVLSLNVLG